MESLVEPNSYEDIKRQLSINYSLLKSGDFPEDVVEDNYREACRELLDNWEDYGDELYHGTSLENFESISIEGALIPGSENDSSTGEVCEQANLYYTSLAPIGVHYAEKAQPCREDVMEAALNDFELDVSSDEWPDSADNYNILHDLIPGGIEDSNISEHVESRYKALYSRLFEIPEENPEPLLVGFSEENADINKQAPEFDHEFEAKKKNKYLAEGKASKVDLDESTSIYIPQNHLEDIREKYSNLSMNILSLDSLKLRHRMKMKPVYQQKGIIEMKPLWKGEKRGIEIEKKSRNPGLSTQISS